MGMRWGSAQDPETTAFYTALACPRGHIQSEALEDADPPIPKACGRCGLALLSACPSCGERVKGSETGFYAARLVLDDFCWSCAAPLPWISREGVVYRLRNLLDGAGLSEGDRRTMEEELVSLLEPGGSPETEGRQIKALETLKTMGADIWKSAVPVLQPIASAALKSALGLP